MTPASVLVTGASGFLGSATLAAARAAWPEARVTGCDLQGGDSPCDLTDGDAVAELCRRLRPDVILHLAGSTIGADLVELRRANLDPLAAVLAAVAAHAPGCRVVVPGSAAEYGERESSAGPIDESAPVRPVAPYGVVKAEQTMLALEAAAAGSQVAVARVFNLCGPGTPERLVLGGVAAQLRRIRSGEQSATVTTGDLSAVRDFVDVADVCAALLALAERGAPGEVYNVCTGVPTTVADAVLALVALSGTGAQVVVKSSAPARANVSYSVGENLKLRSATGWTPRVALRDSLAAMLG